MGLKKAKAASGGGLFLAQANLVDGPETHILLGLGVSPTHPGSGMRVGSLLT